ncbi:hypothetical protein JQ596_03505 [Bradyrhizobium manausense]|uniref:hypothetical protein n=1 Tax=Bradyrhizobium TaxID=374 RepID=UPI001BA50F6D|nr:MULTISPECIES: hypothetical protein [Bradyrhizobium]MBR0824592.1 hypothetical protein [Bradyrhizobium manausense]UVO29619.1 hypothetical protein KUF59_02270 [Bradyrhizobium arachidis]
MQNYAATGPLVAVPNSDSRQLIAAELRNLIAQVEGSMRLIEAAMMREAGDRAGSTDVVVLDDLTPRYATASAALGACKAGLDVALQCLTDADEPPAATWPPGGGRI